MTRDEIERFVTTVIGGAWGPAYAQRHRTAIAAIVDRWDGDVSRIRESRAKLAAEASRLRHPSRAASFTEWLRSLPNPTQWAHCGNSAPHQPHLHSFAMNEGPYMDVPCAGTPSGLTYGGVE